MNVTGNHGINPVILDRWKAEFLEWASDVFIKGPSKEEKQLEKNVSMWRIWSAR